MKILVSLLLITSIISFRSCGQSSLQQKQYADKNEMKVGGSCEGCEAIYESPTPFKDLESVVTLSDFNEPAPKMEISGIIYKADGKTPAPGVVLYIYHTDQTGHYSPGKNAKGWEQRHGYIRGWVKTNAKGEYKFYTLRPASYPGGKAVAHIHPVIKEPGKSAYWIDEFVFDDDPLVTNEYINKMARHGGAGVVKLSKKNGILIGHRDIILGLNIPGYPKENSLGFQSGLKVGSNCPAFDPLHLSGADAGKKVCPMCKYGYGEGVMIWINNTSISTISSFTIMLENEIQKRGIKNFRVFLIYMKPASENENAATKKLISWATNLNLRNVAVIIVPSVNDEKTADAYEINTSGDIVNTVFVYKKRVVADKFINISYDEKSFEKIMKAF
ncbi:MAG: hypothetical protein ABI691_02270 [Ginsengibacter sp.]